MPVSLSCVILVSTNGVTTTIIGSELAVKLVSTFSLDKEAVEKFLSEFTQEEIKVATAAAKKIKQEERKKFTRPTLVKFVDDERSSAPFVFPGLDNDTIKKIVADAKKAGITMRYTARSILHGDQAYNISKDGLAAFEDILRTHLGDDGFDVLENLEKKHTAYTDYCNEHRAEIKEAITSENTDLTPKQVFAEVNKRLGDMWKASDEKKAEDKKKVDEKEARKASKESEKAAKKAGASASASDENTKKVEEVVEEKSEEAPVVVEKKTVKKATTKKAAAK